MSDPTPDMRGLTPEQREEIRVERCRAQEEHDRRAQDHAAAKSREQIAEIDRLRTDPRLP